MTTYHSNILGWLTVALLAGCASVKYGDPVVLYSVCLERSEPQTSPMVLNFNHCKKWGPLRIHREQGQDIRDAHWTIRVQAEGEDE